MTDFPMTEDIVLLNAGDTQRKGMYVEFGLFPTPDGIDPNGRNPFMDMKGGREHGQRFRVTFHLLGENEECTEDGAGMTAEEKMADRLAKRYAPELTEKPADEQTPEPAQTPEEPERVKGGARAKRQWDELTAREQACIRCKEEPFQSWLLNLPWVKAHIRNQEKFPGDDEGQCKHMIYHVCRIRSRSELDTNGLAASVFRGLDNRYRASQTGQSTEALETMLETGP